MTRYETISKPVKSMLNKWAKKNNEDIIKNKYWWLVNRTLVYNDRLAYEAMNLQLQPQLF